MAVADAVPISLPSWAICGLPCSVRETCYDVAIGASDQKSQTRALKKVKCKVLPNYDVWPVD